jgi:SAM-dependent methyltransferase
VAAAVAIGLFIGCLPLYGLHLLLVLLVCVPRRLDSVISYLAANISNPFVAPFLITLEVEIGSLLLTGQHAAFDLTRARATGVAGYFVHAAAGSVVVGTLLALLGGGLAFALSRRFRSAPVASPLDGAIRRTIERYRDAPIADRMYVAGKLDHDPVVREVSSLDGDFGRLLDAGAGRGQLGLCLLELGRASSLFGFDSDERKVRLASLAGEGSARFEVRDLASPDWPACDTLLLVDVLHYLPTAEQDQVLSHAVGALGAGGRLLVRELDAQPGFRSSVTRLFERLATAIGLNRGRARLEYRSAAELTRRLEVLGCACETRSASQGTPFANVLVVAKRL